MFTKPSVQFPNTFSYFIEPHPSKGIKDNMSSKKRKSEEDPTTSTAMSSDNTGKKRRRLSDADSVVDKKSKKSEKEKKSKKSSSKKDKERKHVPSAEDEDDATADNAALEANASPEDTPMDEAPLPAVELKDDDEDKEETKESSKKTSKKDKKDKKSKSKSKSKSKDKSESKANAPQEPTDAEPVDTITTTAAAATTTTNDDEEATPEEPPQGKKVRFIVFVGNLPFSATPEQITTHFSAVHPTSVRLLHDPRTGKSRGIAFVEFARYDHMKSCLKTMHHTTFTCPSGKPGRTEERRINVELTAGGGGNTSHRKEKIRAKNEKLNEERARRAQEEAKAKAEKEKGKGQNGGEKAGGGGVEDAIHPSRRGRVPGAGS